jgi:hypothetical protein
MLSIIENTEIAQKEFGCAWGAEWNQITEDDIKALKDGKQLAFNDGEYVHFLSMSKPK